MCCERCLFYFGICPHWLSPLAVSLAVSYNKYQDYDKEEAIGFDNRRVSAYLAHHESSRCFPEGKYPLASHPVSLLSRVICLHAPHLKRNWGKFYQQEIMYKIMDHHQTMFQTHILFGYRQKLKRILPCSGPFNVNRKADVHVEVALTVSYVQFLILTLICGFDR